MTPLTRRQFLERAAVAGAALCASPLRTGASSAQTSSDVFRPGVTLPEFAAALIVRTAPARRRLAGAAAFISRAHPELRAQILADAENALRGELLLPGSSDLSAVGDPPAWLTPRYGDEEYLWSLNRMTHWKTLLRAHALTGDARYATKVVTELDDWIAHAPPPAFRRADGEPDPAAVGNSGPPPWRSLEIGMRMFDTWPAVLEHLAGTPHLPAERLARIAGSVATHAEALSSLTPLIWPDADHNHYFMEMLGLLSIGVNYPELSESPRWTEQALHELERCVRRQFTRDGSHIEAVPSYHNLCVVLFARYLTLTRAAGRTVPPEFERLAAAAAEHTLHATRPTGTVVPWGDATQRENHVEAALWAYKATGDIDVLRHLAKLTGLEHLQALSAPVLWELDDPESLFRRVAQSPSPRPLVRHDRDNDQVMLRTSWERDALSVFFSCHSPLVPGSGHQHIDLGGFDFTAFGRPLVVDPGVFTYRESDERRIFKSAEWHSVLTIDGRGPFNYINRWRYTPQQEGRVSAVHEQTGRVRVESFHRNYAPALCRRVLELVDGRLLVVIDCIDDVAPDSTVQIYFHLDSTRVTHDAVNRIVTTNDDAVRLLIAPSAGLDCELLPGRVSEQFDIAHASTRVRFADRGGAGRRVYANVLVPSRTAAVAPRVERVAISPDASACTFSCDGREYRVAVR